jgi:LacI family transcriptional regulator
MNMEMLANGSTDGFILSVAKETQQKEDYHHLQEVINQGMPVVMFDRVVEKINCDKVIIDDTEGAKKAVKHLLDLGCRNVGIITTVDYVSVGKLRTRGYTEALEENGIPVNEQGILKIEDVDNSEQEIIQFIQKRDFDGIFAVNEQFCASAVRGLKEKGQQVPDDVRVISFSDGELSKRFIPSFTTINQHGARMGAKAAELLIERLEGSVEAEEKYRTEVMQTSLIQRESTFVNKNINI